jgi:hypothetical protein
MYHARWRERLSRGSMSKTGRPGVRLTQEELATHIASSLINIRRLCEIFDSGHHYIAFTLASEIHRFLISGQRALQIRGDRSFPSPAFDYSEQSVGTEVKLIAVGGRWDKPEEGAYFAPMKDVHGLKKLPFRDWWNREVIYRTRLSEEGRSSLNRTSIFARGRPWISEEAFKRIMQERRLLTRRTFIELVRNKFGAHLDEEVPETLSELMRTDILDFGVIYGGRSITDSLIPPVAAMVRQIAYEVILAFDEGDRNE